MSQKPRQPRPIVYAISSARPDVDLEFTVDPDGRFTVDVMTGWSLPQSGNLRLGRFAGTLEASLLTRLTAIASAAAAAGSAGPQSLDMPSRLAGFAGAPLQPVVDPTGADADLEQQLAASATAALATPLAAVQVAGDQSDGSNGPREGLSIRGIGTEAVPLVVFDPDQPAYWARIWRTDPTNPDGRVSVPYETLKAMADDGRIPSGIADLAPGELLRLPLPEASASDGGFTIWRAGPGPQRRPIAGVWSLAANDGADTRGA